VGIRGGWKGWREGAGGSWRWREDEAAGARAVGDGGRLPMLRFFFLFEIEGEEKEKDTDCLVGGPLAEALEPVMVVKVVRRIDPDAMIADDPFKVRFDAGGKFVIAYIHVEFYAGVCADPVDIIGSVGHPYSVVGGHFAVQDGSLIFIDFNPVAE
jgi:hypothetical protein